MARYQFTRKAIEDLTTIWEYTVAEWSEKQADKYYKLLIDTCAEIAKDPRIGKKYFEIYPELHGVLISKHIIFYRATGKKTVEIIRILHAEMDLKTKLED